MELSLRFPSSPKSGKNEYIRGSRSFNLQTVGKMRTIAAVSGLILPTERLMTTWPSFFRSAMDRDDLDDAVSQFDFRTA
jgi:hypothetical protein